MKTTRTIEGIIADVAERRRGTVWSVALSLAPWRESDGQVAKSELFIVLPVRDEAAARRLARRLRGELGQPLRVSTRTSRRGVLEATSPVRKTDGEVFVFASKSMAMAREHIDAVLGTLRLDRGMGWFERTRTIGKKPYTLAVKVSVPDDDAVVKKAVLRAGPIVTKIEGAWAELLDAVTNALFPVYDTRWRGDEKALSRAAFKKRLTPSEMVVDATRTTVYLRAGELFGDHGVEVRIPAKGTKREILVS